ncbi:MAG: ribosome maturation factor RimP [Gammaproteobacteria bacterium]|nr:ribosome maturation factor RimP [Gammaproteobacteria bacterium]
MLDKRIHDLIEPTIRSLGLDLWACDLRKSGNQALLRIYIDRESGVTLEDCTVVSREIGALLDVEDPIKNHYQLEVSSPGLDRLLLTLAHFERYVGQNVKIKLRSSQDNRRQLVGRIEKIAEDKIFLLVDTNTISVKLNEVQKANLVSAQSPSQSQS